MRYDVGRRLLPLNAGSLVILASTHTSHRLRPRGSIKPERWFATLTERARSAVALRHSPQHHWVRKRHPKLRRPQQSQSETLRMDGNSQTADRYL